MPPRIGTISPQALNEVYGQIVGLYDDPTNDPSGVIYSGVFVNSSALVSLPKANIEDKKIFWSRFLVCEILTPYNNESYTNLALVLRPQATWLYKMPDSPPGRISDYMGSFISNIASIASGTISPPVPTYAKGDIIRIGALPAMMTAAPLSGNWNDGFFPHVSGIFAGYSGTSSPLKTPSGLYIPKVMISGSRYNSKYANESVNYVAYYDKNVDARSRFGGQGGGDIKVMLCDPDTGEVKCYLFKGKVTSC